MLQTTRDCCSPMHLLTCLRCAEPTSGLDAAAAYHVTRVIKRLCMHESGSGGAAGAPRTVACVIHQPASEVFDCFDSLALLADGATVYFGPAGSAADFFASAASLPVPHNRSAADHLLHCVNADFGEVAVVAENVQKCEAGAGPAALLQRLRYTPALSAAACATNLACARLQFRLARLAGSLRRTRPRHCAPPWMPTWRR
jgi:hypothetical protein